MSSVTTVDQSLSDKPAPLVWKVDVEGFEPDVLRGAVQALRNPELRTVLTGSRHPSLAASGAAQSGASLPCSGQG